MPTSKADKQKLAALRKSLRAAMDAEKIPMRIVGMLTGIHFTTIGSFLRGNKIAPENVARIERFLEQKGEVWSGKLKTPHGNMRITMEKL